MPGHRRAGAGVISRDGPRLGQGGIPGGPLGIVVGLVRTGGSAQRGLVRGQRAAGTPGQVHRGRPGLAEQPGRGGHVIAPAGGQRDPERAGHPEHGRAADHQTADRIHQLGNGFAGQDLLLGRQPGLVEQGDRRSARRVEPAQRGHVHDLSLPPGPGQVDRRPRGRPGPGSSPAPFRWPDFMTPPLRASMGASGDRGASPAIGEQFCGRVPRRRTMTDSPSSDAPGDGQAQRPQPWFPPGGGYGPGSPAPGQAPPGPPGTEPPGTGPSGTGPSGTGQPDPPGWPGWSQPGYGQPGPGQPGSRRPAPGPPGYGQPPPGQWPRYSEAAPKPGVIPLRPLGVGEILDGAFASIRRNPKAVLGLAAVVMTIAAVISAV